MKKFGKNREVDPRYLNVPVKYITGNVVGSNEGGKDKYEVVPFEEWKNRMESWSKENGLPPHEYTLEGYKAWIKFCEENGIKCEKTSVGDRYVLENMVENGYSIGGEQSGHIIFSKYASTGDGILTSLKVLEVMMAQKKKMSQLWEGLQIYPQVLKNVRVKDKPTAQNDPKVQAAVQAVADKLGATGRILVRESGTEPVIRVMVEAPTKEQCQKCVDSVVDVICAQGHARV